MANLFSPEVDNCPLVVNSDQEDCDTNGVGDHCDPNGPTIEIHASKHTVGSGSDPGSTKEDFNPGIEVCAYDKSETSCARTECGGILHQFNECIATTCAATNSCTTDITTGEFNLNLPPGDYVIISADATKTVLPDPLGVSASNLLCGEHKQKHLQQIIKAGGNPE